MMQLTTSTTVRKQAKFVPAIIRSEDNQETLAQIHLIGEPFERGDYGDGMKGTFQRFSLQKGELGAPWSIQRPLPISCKQVQAQIKVATLPTEIGGAGLLQLIENWHLPSKQNKVFALPALPTLEKQQSLAKRVQNLVGMLFSFSFL